MAAKRGATLLWGRLAGMGVRRAAGRRTLQRLGFEGVDQTRVEEADQRLSDLESSERRLSSELSEFARIVAAEFARVRSQADELSADVHRSEQSVRQIETELAPGVADLRAMVADLRSSLDVVRRELSSVRRQADGTGRILAATAWLSAINVTEAMKISVVMATYNRAERLERAIESVRSQVYRKWELIVVDDGSTDGTAELLARVSAEDERIVVVSRDHRGAGPARNAGLRRATGSVVCYLDDDNFMQPLWLKAVAWAFGSRPDLQVLYGAVASTVPAPQGDHGVPWLIFEPFDRSSLEQANFIDLGAIAHVRDHPEAQHDESLPALIDWDLMLRLTCTSEPLALPVVALAYTTDAPNRISDSGLREDAAHQVRAKVRRSRPLRVLAYNAVYPVVTESYIGAELEALTSRGAVLACCSTTWQPSPVIAQQRFFPDLTQAVESFEPDLILMHWATFARDQLDLVQALGVPFAVRVHSFDFRPPLIEELRVHPLCLGIWAYPHHARMIPGSHELLNLIAWTGHFPDQEQDRTVVLAACAGLPKKDWPTLLDAFAELADKGADCRLVVGITNAFEDEPAKVRAMIGERRANIRLSVDVPHDQVRALLARTAIVVYTKQWTEPLGMPTSIIEGMLAGTSVLLPDEPSAELVGGPRCRKYLGSGDIVRHVSEVLSGGEAVLAEQAFNRRWARQRYADPTLADRFYDQLAEALARWREGNSPELSSRRW